MIDPMLKVVVWGIVAVVALVLLGSLVVSVLGALFKLGFYLLVGLAVVGGALYLFGRARRGVTGAGRRSIR
jgi:Family of unknown function (DUF5326)